MQRLVASVLVLGAVVWGQQNCYECNSAVDPLCGEEFEEAAFSKFEVSCTASASKPKTTGPSGGWQPTGCRKIVQEVQNSERIVRQCAYSGEDVDGFKRTGNEGVRLWYYQCSDNDFCNHASPIQAALFLVAPLALLLPLLR